MLSEDLRKQFDELRAQYPSGKSALLGALHIAQEHYGYLCPEILEDIADYFGKTPSEVESTVTFYTMYTKRPLGKYRLQVCTNIPCGLLGADSILNHLSEKLGIKVGETTPDGKFTLETAECLGTCGGAPVMQVNETFYENLTAEKIDELLASLE